MPGDDPDHPECVHHGWDGLENDVEVGAVGDVLEVALESGEEADVVLGFRVEVGQLGSMDFEVLNDDRIGFR